MDKVSSSQTQNTSAEVTIIMPTRKCPECGGVVAPGYTELVYELEYLVRIKDVPTQICAACGHSFVSGRVATEVNRLVNRVIEDVVSFAKTQPNAKKNQRVKEIAIAV